MPFPSVLRTVGDLILPRPCVACGRPDGPLCRWCGPAGAPAAVRVTALAVWAAGGYDAGLRTALLAYKERGRLDLARPLGTLLAGAVDAAVAGQDGPVCLVPVPSSARARRDRGGDHVLRLARAAGGSRHLGVVRALRLTREVSDSAGLGRRQRAANLADAFAADPPRPGPAPLAVIVDDIVTTGATLREAARALELAGWPGCVGAVVAATARNVDHATPVTSGDRFRRGLPWG